MSEHRDKVEDRGDSLRQILSRRGFSLAAELLAIQQHAEPAEKSHEWAANPLCLWYRRSSPTCFVLAPNQELKKEFVAVSWTWEPSIYEDRTSGRYSMIRPNSLKGEALEIRNMVLDRIVKYLEQVEIDVFWIDRVCIDQNNLAQKAKALNSMDLAYRNAPKVLGLLTTPIHTRKGLRLIEALLSGDTCRNLQQGTNYDDVISTIEILHDLTKDRWWSRAWVFQEEYISGLQMDLLIPLGPGVRPFSDCDLISEELQVSATLFREQATVFLLDYLDTGWKLYRI